MRFTDENKVYAPTITTLSSPQYPYFTLKSSCCEQLGTPYLYSGVYVGVTSLPMIETVTEKSDMSVHAPIEPCAHPEVVSWVSEMEATPCE